MKTIFDKWILYETIVDNNYMNHKEILTHIKRTIQQDNYSMLDLGCGDATLVTQAYTHCSKMIYTGVDLSKEALEKAKQKIKHYQPSWRTSFYCENMLSFFHKNKQCFDLVNAGFSVHHLSIEEKKKLFLNISNSLSENGYFFYYDICKHVDEERLQAIERIFNYYANNWKILEESQLKEVQKHMIEYDFPETIEKNEDLLKEANLNYFKILYEDSEKKYFLAKVGH